MIVFFVIAFLGWLFGSLTNVLIHRIPREIPLGLFSHRRSFCPHCEKTIAWYDNVPLLSFFILKGKCRHCQKPISLRYPTVELLSIVFFCITYWVHRHSPEPLYDPRLYFVELAKNLYFTMVLIAIVFIDLDFRIIPDRFSLGSWVLALLASYFWGRPLFLDGLIGGLLGFGVFFALAWTYEKIKKVEGLGMGDVKMLGWLGTWVGFFGLPFLVLVASFSGLVVGLWAMRKSKDGLQTAIPFGPFLAMGAYLTWILRTLGQW